MSNGREPKSCLGQVFNFKLGCFVMCTIAWSTQAQPSLMLKTQPRFCPVSLTLSMQLAINITKVIKLLKVQYSEVCRYLFHQTLVEKMSPHF